MKRNWPWVAYWVILGLPAMCFIIANAAPVVLGCEANPYEGWTCPDFIIFLLPATALGFYTLIPFLAIGGIWLIMAIVIFIVRRRNI